MMNWKKDKWIWIKAVLLLASPIYAAFDYQGDPDPTSYPFVTTLPFLFFALFLPAFLRNCETTKRYTSRLAIWRAHPFLMGTGPFPFYHFGTWSLLARGIVALPMALFARRDLAVGLFALSAGAGGLIGVHRALKRNMNDLRQTQEKTISGSTPEDDPSETCDTHC